MGSKIISDLPGVPHEIGEQTRLLQEDELFKKHPFLNSLCLKKIYKSKNSLEFSYGLVAGVSEIDKNKGGDIFRGDPPPIPDYVSVPSSVLMDYYKNEDFGPVIAYDERFHKKNGEGIYRGDDNPFNQYEMHLPLIQVQMDVAKTHEGTATVMTPYEKHKANPLRSGVSLGNPRYSGSGTLGAICRLKGLDGYYIISNWHVMVGRHGKINDRIIQPSVEHGGSVVNDRDLIATLLWYRLDKYCDLAIAKLDDDIAIHEVTRRGAQEILGLMSPNYNMNVFINGLNGKRTGTIVSTDCTVRISSNQYPQDETILRNQIIATQLSEPGDSGSLVVNTGSKKAVGVIVGGDAKSYSVINPLDFHSPITYSICTKYSCNTGLVNIEIESII